MDGFFCALILKISFTFSYKRIQLEFYSAKQIDFYFDHKEFVDFLQEFYKKDIFTPIRHHHQLGEDSDGTMLIMPSWSTGDYMGVKLVNVFPENREVPTINGLYVLMNRKTGEMLAQFDGLSLTCKRTASVSALAAKLISPTRRKTMLMIGTGNMSEELIRAHHRIQQFSSIYIWGRNYEKAKAKANLLKKEGYPIVAIADKNSMMKAADLVSVATLSEKPLVFGKDLQHDAYVDLVGSYKPTTREADDEVIQGAKIFVDNYAALEESGDLKIPMDDGIIGRQDILADIIELSKEAYVPSVTEHDKIVFKSVGFAASDLACAVFILKQYGYSV